MAMFSLKGRKLDFSTVLIVFFLALFFLCCLFHKLLLEFSAGDYGKILTRCLLVSLAAVFIAFRLQRLQIIKGKDWFYFVLSCFFIVIIFSPLVSQLSFLQKSVWQTTKSIVNQHDAKIAKVIFLLNDFSKVYQQRFAKKFIIPQWYINLEALVKVYGLGVSPNTNIAVGKRGFYFEGWGARKVEKGVVAKFDNIADYMGQIPFSQEELEHWRRVLEERAYWLKERGINYVFVLAPTKALVYPEYLPRSLQIAIDRGRANRYQQLSTYLREKSTIHFIDLLPPLLAAKKKRDYPLLFYKTDFHWNFYGAFIAYQAMARKLAEMFPLYHWVSPDFSEFTVSIDRHWAHYRFMKMVGLPPSLLRNEHYITMVPKANGRWQKAEDLPVKGIYDFYPPVRKITAPDNSSVDIRLIRNPAAPVPSLLLLGDSFLEKCVYFFSADAQEVFNQRTVMNFPEELFAYIHPTIVVQEILNMFILGKLPVNPPGFRESYLRGKFAGGINSVLFTASKFVPTAKNWQCGIKLHPKKNFNDKLLARLVIDAKTAGAVSVVFRGEASEQTFSKQLQAGKNTLFFELPDRKYRKILLQHDKFDAKDYTPVAFEIRGCR